MLKKLVLATAAAGFVGLGALGATATPAAADPFNNYHHHRHHHQHRVCGPVVKYVKWFDRHGHKHWKKVTRIECSFRWN